MARAYGVSCENQSITNANGDYDLVEISPADDKPVRLRGLVLSQLSELGDAAEEALRIAIIRGYTSSGSGGNAPTPTPLDQNDAAAGFSAETANSTVATTGTAVTPVAFAWNLRNSPYEMWWPDDRIAVKASQANTTLIARLMAAVADDITASFTAYIEEE